MEASQAAIAAEKTPNSSIGAAFRAKMAGEARQMAIYAF
jgi:hypothetical protein